MYKQFAKNIYSQNGEDGIIEKIFQDLKIEEGICVEFGAWNGIFCSNIYNIWKNNKNFKAILIEKDLQKYKELLLTCENSTNVETYNCEVSPDKNNKFSLDKILEKSNFFNLEKYILLSIDVDSCDYYIFDSIEKYYPWIIICEVSGGYGNHEEYITMDSGCSLYSLNKLAEKKGYKLIFYTGNAFFVREDILKKFNLKNLSFEEAYNTPEELYNFYQKLDNDGNLMNEYYYLSNKYLGRSK